VSRDAFVGNVILWLASGGSPPTFAAMCEAFGISGIGESNEQIDSTDFCSGGVKEYIAGLADGSEITIELNFMAKAGIEAKMEIQRQLIQAVKDKAILEFQLRCDGDGDGVTDLTFHFAATALSWTLNPSPSAKNAISFGVKITGGVDITEP
jgi:hypothetical protein